MVTYMTVCRNLSADKGKGYTAGDPISPSELNSPISFRCPRALPIPTPCGSVWNNFRPKTVFYAFQ